MITVEYECADGTPFPVRFRDEEQAASQWRHEREHGRDPLTPLGDAFEHLGVAGSVRAYEEMALPNPPFFDKGPDANGFAYFRDGPPSPEFMAGMVEGCARLIEQHGSALGIWHGHCLPRAKEACAEIDAAGDDVPLSRLTELQHYALHMTMIPAYVCGNDLTLLTGAIAALYPDSAPLVANELTQGFENETLRADQLLWEVGRVARAHDDVRRALAAGDPPGAMAALRAADRAPEFFEAVDRYLDEYGFRAEGWDIACPTWNEQREGFWAQLGQMASDAVPEPAQARAKAAGRRHALVAEVEAQLAGDEQALARFGRRLARIVPYVAVREERALWQVGSIGALRHAVLRRGRGLVSAGIIDDAEDALFLVPDEIESPPDDLREVVAERRAAHALRCRLAPPPVIGGSTPASASPSATDDGLLRGAAASRGVVTGRARVIVDLDEADRLEPGDVLVCVMTSPPWTPLFGIAGAVVADSGDIGSHPAIAAREYGIPCVLGLRNATRSIPDGALVTVDGAAGTVQLAGLP